MLDDMSVFSSEDFCPRPLTNWEFLFHWIVYPSPSGLLMTYLASQTLMKDLYVFEGSVFA
jgi:hypothetical protein